MARFGWLCGDVTVSREFWDVDLTPAEEFATVPSVGSIVADWLLFLPRRPRASIAAMDAPSRMRLLAHARRIMEAIHGRDVERVAFFEHGAGRAGSQIGCGVDHAHLHAVPLPFSLSKAFRAENDYVASVRSDDPWSTVEDDEYLLCIDAEEALHAPVQVPVSQYFRRVIAREMGRKDAWDYRAFPFPANIEATVKRFHAAR